MKIVDITNLISTISYSFRRTCLTYTGQERVQLKVIELVSAQRTLKAYLS
ncbi:MAG: hypothetical protein KME55_22780 [Nostoc indistinguendum CM1-VF10]|nr:hypothetical protein [Nostoc indistinguendum CM1-VF10]